LNNLSSVWINKNRIVTEAREGEIDIEISKSDLDKYAERGARFMQVRLPCGCYIPVGWYPDDVGKRVNVRLRQVQI
jgi:hypothetical protein